MFTKITLPNSLRVVTVPMPQVKSVTALVLVDAGSRYETPKNNGVSHFLEHMTFKGTKRRPNKLALTSPIDAVGGIYNAYTNKENVGFYIKAPAEHLELALDILSDALKNSLFDEREIEKEKGVIIEEINMYEDEPASKVWDVLEKLLYGIRPLGRRILGEKETVRHLTRDTIVDYFQTHYSPRNIVIGLAGRLTKDTSKLIKKYFGNLPDTPGPKAPKEIDKQSSPMSAVYYKKTDQAHLVFAFRAYSLHHRDRFVTGVLSSLLGGYMSSRLFIEVRDKRGLAYYVGADKAEFRDVGYFNVYAGVRISDIEQAIKVILSELVKLKEKKVTTEELRRAKDNWKGRMTLSLENSNSVAGLFAGQELTKREILTPQQILRRVERVTPEDIQRTAKDIFVDQKLNLAVVGPYKDQEKFTKLLKI